MHELSWETEGWVLSDQALCSCGWKSRAYWDGADFAYDEWKKHKESQSPLIDQGMGL